MSNLQWSLALRQCWPLVNANAITNAITDANAIGITVVITSAVAIRPRTSTLMPLSFLCRTGAWFGLGPASVQPWFALGLTRIQLWFSLGAVLG